ncbi:MAG: Dephospho-CoA kinase [Cyanobacteriota bacterium]|jgi:dephospho-CoA kinase
MASRRRIGLTGGIATGKSSVARCLSERFGLPVLDADRFSHEVLAPGTEATRAVMNRYGHAIRAPQGQDEPAALDRRALARIVFADEAERRWLERLVHPLVRHRMENALALLESEPVVILMIPLLFETGLDALCSEIWLVDCGDEGEQIRRLMARDQLSLDEAKARITAQWPMAAKRARADVILDNSGEPNSWVEHVGRSLALSDPPAVAFSDGLPSAVPPIGHDAPPTA